MKESTRVSEQLKDRRDLRNALIDRQNKIAAQIKCVESQIAELCRRSPTERAAA